MMDLKAGTRIHFVGIGGVSMSALAELLHRRGCRVTGSDRQASELTDRLEAMGIGVQIGHTAGAVGDAECVVYNSAASSDNPELLAARARGIPLLRRAEFLGHLSAAHRTVAVAGTHGKTTTTAMVGAVLEAAGQDPTVLVGGVVRGPESNLRVGDGDIWAVEADEFDRSFLTLTPTVAVVTSLEEEHLDCYGDLASIRAAFEQFLGAVQAGGWAVLCGDDPGVRDLNISEASERVLYGLGGDTRIQAADVVREGFGSRFQVLDAGKALGEVRLQAPGMHNVSNALAAVGVGRVLDLPWEAVASGLASFRGVHRRFEIVGEAGGVTVVNDYAHHPTEIRATLATARAGWDGRILAVFQPHLYSRTRDFAPAFGEALSAADRVWVADVYPAREAPLPGVTGGLVAEAVRTDAVDYVPEFKDLGPAVTAELKPGDLVVVMGAGDVERVAYEVYETLRGVEVTRG